MKTILFVESGSGYGGSATCLANLVQELDKNRFRPIVAYYSAGPGIDRIIQAGTPTIRLTRGLRLFQLMSAIRSNNVDLCTPTMSSIRTCPRCWPRPGRTARA